MADYPCKVCGVSKPPGEFYRNDKYTLKHVCICKPCYIARQIAHNKAKRARDREEKTWDMESMEEID